MISFYKLEDIFIADRSLRPHLRLLVIEIISLRYVWNLISKLTSWIARAEHVCQLGVFVLPLGLLQYFLCNFSLLKITFRLVQYGLWLERVYLRWVSRLLDGILLAEARYTVFSRTVSSLLTQELSFQILVDILSRVTKECIAAVYFHLYDTDILFYIVGSHKFVFGALTPHFI